MNTLDDVSEDVQGKEAQAAEAQIRSNGFGSSRAGAAVFVWLEIKQIAQACGMNKTCVEAKEIL